MIVGAPEPAELTETAVGWLNLAWDIVIQEAKDFQEIEHLYAEVEERDGREIAERAIHRHWTAKRLKLNNALSLLQQSLELFLKARVAEVSPFLLIVGDPQSWPSTDRSGNVDFADFRTLDSVHLCRAARIVSANPLSENFVQFYGRLRKERNKIVHLNAGRMKAEVHGIVVEILEAHRLLFPNQPWVLFRRRYLESTGEYSDEEGIFTGEDYTNDTVCDEVRAALNELSAQHQKLYFQFDKRKKVLRCPRCFELRADNVDEEWEFAQKQKDGSIRCVACLSTFDQSDYVQRMLDCFGYLGESEQLEIKRDVERDLQ